MPKLPAYVFRRSNGSYRYKRNGSPSTSMREVFQPTKPRASAIRLTTGLGSTPTSKGNGWGRANTKTKPASHSGGLGVLSLFLQRGVGEGGTHFKLNHDTGLTERALLLHGRTHAHKAFDA